MSEVIASVDATSGGGTVVAIIQARMGSTRLPGKVLKALRDKTVLAWVVERAMQASMVGEVIVATSNLVEDDAIVQEARRLDIEVVRGDSLDVLSRYALAVQRHGPEHIVRVTADCPCLDPDIVDRLVATHLARRGDYTSNVHPRSYPHGLDAEVVSRDALLAAAREATVPEDREHVLSFVWRRPERFSLVNIDAREGERAPGLRITLDTAADYLMLRALFDHLPASFRLANILSAVAKHPWLAEINAEKRQKNLPLPGGDSAETLPQQILDTARWAVSQEMFGAAAWLIKGLDRPAELKAANERSRSDMLTRLRSASGSTQEPSAPGDGGSSLLPRHP